MKNAAAVLIIFVCAFCLAAQYAGAVKVNDDPVARVLIFNDRDSFSIYLKDNYRITSIDTGQKIMWGKYLNITVRASSDGVYIGKKLVRGHGIRLKTFGDTNVYVNKRIYRGEVDIVLKDNGKLMAVNHVGLEEYLYGVLYHEVSHRWPIEALKAQAIASRTFALYQMQQNKLQPYDLRSDIYSQVYMGKDFEKWVTTRAVDLTRGRVLTYNGKILPAYFHAACAGHTEDALALWNTDLPPLKGVECGYCTESPHYRWTRFIPSWVMTEKLNQNGYKVGQVVAVNIISKNSSGRVEKIELRDDAGVSVVLTGKDFRRILGPNNLRSTKFDATIRLGNMVLDGYGWGHGVGMCQWGVCGMAKTGKHADEILAHYYPGAQIVSDADLAVR